MTKFQGKMTSEIGMHVILKNKYQTLQVKELVEIISNAEKNEK